MTTPTPTARRHSLLDVVTVSEEPAGTWTRAKEPEEFLDRLFVSTTVDICDPPQPMVDLPDTPIGELFGAQALSLYAQAPTRCCNLDELAAALGETAGRASEFLAARHLHSGGGLGDPDEVYLAHDDIETVTATGNMATDLAAALVAFYDKSPHGTPLLHLGVESAIVLALGLQNLDVRWYYSPAFPPKTIVVTDADVRIQLTPYEKTATTLIDINRHMVELTSFFRIVFDVTKAVRVESV